MYKLKLTKHVLPHGIKNEVEVDLPNDATLKKANEIIAAGYRFEIEELNTGLVGVSCDGYHPEYEEDNYITLRTCKYTTEAIAGTLCTVISTAHKTLRVWGRLSDNPQSEKVKVEINSTKFNALSNRKERLENAVKGIKSFVGDGVVMPSIIRSAISTIEQEITILEKEMEVNNG